MKNVHPIMQAALAAWFAPKTDAAPLPTNLGPMTPAEIDDELTYRSYSANRGYGLSPERLAGFFGDEPARQMEERYRSEASHGRV